MDNYAFYIDELIKQKHFSDMTPTVRDELKKDIQEQLNNLFLDRIIDTLSVEDAGQFVLLLKEKKSTEAIEQFVQNHVNNYKMFTEKVFREFAQVYLG
jgi:hypothetical protein